LVLCNVIPDTVRVERTNPDLVAAFASVMRERRKALGLSQEELAFRADLSVSYISFLETKRRQPSLTVMDVLGRQLGLSLVELMTEIERIRRTS